MAPDQPQDQHRAKQLKPHHVEYWRCRGMSMDQSKMCARAGRDVFDPSSGPPSGGHKKPQSRSSSCEPRGRQGRGLSQPPPQQQERQPRGRSRNPSGGRGGGSRGPSVTPAQPALAAHAPVSLQQIFNQNARNGSTSHATVEAMLQMHRENTVRAVNFAKSQTTEMKPLYVSLMIDTSRSMDGESISNVMDKCIKMLKVLKSIQDTAKVSLYHFDTEVKEVVRRKRVNVIDTKRVKKAAVAAAAKGKRTALYDAIATGLDNFRDYQQANRTPDMQYFLTVFTDGEDNKSSTTLESVRQALSEPGVPNFNFFLISATLQNAEKMRLDGLCTKPSCKHVSVRSTSKDDLDRGFEQFTTRMSETVRPEITSQNGSQPVMDHFLRGMQQLPSKSGGGRQISDANLRSPKGAPFPGGVRIHELPPDGNKGHNVGAARDGRGRGQSCEPGQQRWRGRSSSARRARG